MQTWLINEVLHHTKRYMVKQHMECIIYQPTQDSRIFANTLKTFLDEFITTHISYLLRTCNSWQSVYSFASKNKQIISKTPFFTILVELPRVVKKRIYEVQGLAVRYHWLTREAPKFTNLVTSTVNTTCTKFWYPHVFFYLSKGPKSPKNKAVLCADLQLPSRKKRGLVQMQVWYCNEMWATG